MVKLPVSKAKTPQRKKKDPLIKGNLKWGSREEGTGRSGNPAGRPKGTRNGVVGILDQIGQDNAERLVRKLIRLGLSGDVNAIVQVMKRAWPERQGGAPTVLALPVINTMDDVVRATNVVTQACADGVINLEEAELFHRIVQFNRITIETANYAERLGDVEARLAKALDSATGGDDI